MRYNCQTIRVAIRQDIEWTAWEAFHKTMHEFPRRLVRITSSLQIELEAAIAGCVGYRDQNAIPVIAVMEAGGDETAEYGLAKISGRRKVQDQELHKPLSR